MAGKWFKGEEPTWEEDCLHWWGRVLTGDKAHWCYAWDDLPIDETCGEFDACQCIFEEK